MGPVAAALALALHASAPAEAPSAQALVFYNARMALREKQPAEALKLWLLRNALKDQGQPGPFDAEFRSVVWAGAGALGVCSDGFPKDGEGGAGLWPLGMHNWLLTAAKGAPPGMREPFDAFDVGRQQRQVSLQDVLSAAELRSVTFSRTSCFRAKLQLLDHGEWPLTDITDRLVHGRLMRQLLVHSLKTLDRSKVRGLSTVEARIFDLDLALAKLQRRRADQAGSAARQKARVLGVSEAGALEVKATAAAWPAQSPQGVFLRSTLGWKVGDWLELSTQRRLALFALARRYAASPEETTPLVLSLIDALTARGEGQEVEAWAGFLEAKDAPARRDALTSGERGQRLLALDAAAQFRERAVLALHRGVAQVQEGQTQDALRSFAYALSRAPESRASEKAGALSRRWLSYVVSRHQTDAQLVLTLKALVPAPDFNAILEELLWSAALRADAASFERVAGSLSSRGDVQARVGRLRLLAQGKAGALATGLRDSAKEEPYLTLRFSKQLVEKLEAEEATVRSGNAALLKALLSALEAVSGSKAQERTASELVGRVQSMLEGLRQLEASESDKARAMAPGHEAFAGNIRLAPADPLPWPFEVPELESPSAFAPLALVPQEWRGERGELVFGWRVTE